MFCVQCGSELAAPSRFCAKCGTAAPLQPPVAPAAPPLPPVLDALRGGTAIRKRPVLLGSGGLLLLIAFFMPWISVSCAGHEVARFSGADLAVGPRFENQKSDGDILLYLVPIVAVAAILLAVYVYRRAPSMLLLLRATPFILGAIGFLPTILKWISLQNDLAKEPADTRSLVSVGTQAGFWLAIIAAAVIAGTGVVPSTDDG